MYYMISSCSRCAKRKPSKLWTSNQIYFFYRIRMASNGEMQIINPLHQIVSILGTLEAWPAVIIKLIFIGDNSTLNVFRIAAFFFGNKVPLDVAFNFYRMCSGHNRTLALFQFTMFYEIHGNNLQ